MTDFVLTSEKVCVGSELSRKWIQVAGEKIVAVSETPIAGHSIVDLGARVIMPGLVDSHVHINEPGRTEWEGFETATHAAAAGGVTSLVDMPLNCIPVTTTAAALREKLQAVKEKLWVDVGFWGGATPNELAELPALLEAGVLGVKSFMIDSGIPEFPPMTLPDIEQAMPLLARANLPYLFHAELDGGENYPEGPSYDLFLKSRPKSWEDNAIAAVIQIAKKNKAKAHIVHLSSAEALSQIRKAKAEGISLSVETCPHYLLLSDEQVKKFEPKSEQTLFKCCPPIREEKNREALWAGLLDGTIDMVVSDHSPCTPALKCFGSEDFAKAWGGISSLQYTLSLLWSEGEKHSVTLPQISKWLSRNPARMTGLKEKGEIAVGKDADFLVFDPDVRWTINAENTLHRHKGSPYQGRTVRGKVLQTYLRGRMIFDQGKFQQSGKFLLRSGT